MSSDNLERQLREILSTVVSCEVPHFDPSDDLTEVLGLDSLAGLRMLAAIEKKFGIRFPDDRLGEFHTLKSLIEFIEKERKESGS